MPFSDPKSITLKLLNPSYFSCACLDDKPTPYICNVKLYNFASPLPNTYPYGCVVINKKRFLYKPSIHFNAYFNGNYLNYVIFDFILLIS